MMQIPKLQIPVAHACNLACDNCSHYSNFGHKGIVAVDEINRWLSLWSPRVQPWTFFRREVASVCGMCPATPRIVEKPWPMPHEPAGSTDPGVSPSGPVSWRAGE